MLIGYMRVSSAAYGQVTDLQRDALLSAGVDARHMFEDHASGAKNDRPGLNRALDFVCSGDVLVVWKLDRLGRSLSHLLTIINTLKDKQVAFRSLTEGMDTTKPLGELLKWRKSLAFPVTPSGGPSIGRSLKLHDRIPMLRYVPLCKMTQQLATAREQARQLGDENKRLAQTKACLEGQLKQLQSAL